jgi:spore maturation protein CgeB
MKLLLVDSSSHYPANPIFVEAAEALAREFRLEYQVVDEAKFFRIRSLRERVLYRLLGRRPYTFWRFNEELIKRAAAMRPDLIVVAKGQFVAPHTLQRIKQLTSATLVNYATDDPFNDRSSSRFVRQSIRQYDLYASTKRAVIPDLQKQGVRAEYVQFGYKPTVHRPLSLSPEDKLRFASDVAFIGGADADRVGFFQLLVAQQPGTRLRLYGGRWSEYPALAPFHRGEVYGDDYRKVMAGTAIAVNLVRRQNRDDHVMRTFEAPACGAFVLSERTPAHLALLAEDSDAVYFTTPEEMCSKVRQYLANPEQRKAIAANGYRRIVEGRHTYADRLKEIIGLVSGIDRSLVPQVHEAVAK